MCKQLENVSESEWEDMKKTVASLNDKVTKWGGGLGVVLFLVTVFGLWLLMSISSFTDSAKANTEAIIRLQTEITPLAQSIGSDRQAILAIRDLISAKDTETRALVNSRFDETRNMIDIKTRGRFTLDHGFEMRASFEKADALLEKKIDATESDLRESLLDMRDRVKQLEIEVRKQ